MPLQKRRIIIVGAGIFGTALAYQMASPQSEVVLIESGPGPACGVTGRLRLDQHRPRNTRQRELRPVAECCRGLSRTDPRPT
ncbi:FAD-dependent oxidoreductase [Rhizobium rhizophilum]|uniref:FAD-dependent oxidoreductase n=1 Tax=Rhizobium rhizophilum TaxID=1850373 RepID=A0ABY2QUE8_9HYPH|nr:FAD-dependent oxidoreductase [Rhizobium rhizophilum]